MKLRDWLIKELGGYTEGDVIYIQLKRKNKIEKLNNRVVELVSKVDRQAKAYADLMKSYEELKNKENN